MPGFQEFFAAMTNARHPERKRLVTWYGRLFDPDNIDLPTINARIGKLPDAERSAKSDTPKAEAPSIEGPSPSGYGVRTKNAEKKRP